MRHRFANKTLTRNTNYNSALLYNLTKSLIEHKRIKTTLVKAKALRSFVERLVTIARQSDVNTASFSVLQSRLFSKKDLIAKLIEISQNYKDRPGGYTRVLKLGKRQGDNADVALIEFV